VRTLLIAVLVLSLPLSWFAVKLYQARKQREAVEEVVRLGGFVWYDYQVDSGSQWASWLRQMLGDDFFHSVVGVIFQPPMGTDISNEIPVVRDEHLILLRAFPKVRFITITSKAVTDSGVEHLGNLEELERLDLQETQVGDTGLDYLKTLARLRELYLYGTKVTPEAVQRLQQSLPDCTIEHVEGNRTVFFPPTGVPIQPGRPGK
jgi:hypothetical protein